MVLVLSMSNILIVEVSSRARARMREEQQTPFSKVTPEESDDLQTSYQNGIKSHIPDGFIHPYSPDFTPR